MNQKLNELITAMKKDNFDNFKDKEKIYEKTFLIKEKYFLTFQENYNLLIHEEGFYLIDKKNQNNYKVNTKDTYENAPFYDIPDDRYHTYFREGEDSVLCIKNYRYGEAGFFIKSIHNNDFDFIKFNISKRSIEFIKKQKDYNESIRFYNPDKSKVEIDTYCAGKLNLVVNLKNKTIILKNYENYTDKNYNVIKELDISFHSLYKELLDKKEKNISINNIKDISKQASEVYDIALISQDKKLSFMKNFINTIEYVLNKTDGLNEYIKNNTLFNSSEEDNIMLATHLAGNLSTVNIELNPFKLNYNGCFSIDESNIEIFDSIYKDTCFLFNHYDKIKEYTKNYKKTKEYLTKDIKML